MSHVMSAVFFLGLSLFVLGANAKAADYIVPCHIKDSADCYLSSARKALPHLAAQADPLKMDDVNADHGDLLFRLKNCVLTGLKNCKIIKIERLDQFKAMLVLECPVEVKGHYTLGGTLVGLPVDGSGGVRIQTDSIQFTITIVLKSYKDKNNEDHYKVAKFDYEYNPLTQVHYDFENLYGGNAEKAKPMLKIMNDVEPSKEMLRTMGKPVVEEAVKKIIAGVENNVFKKYAAKDIELP